MPNKDHEAVSACFQKKVILFVRKESLAKELQCIARWVVAPPLIGRCVRRHAPLRGRLQ